MLCSFLVDFRSKGFGVSGSGSRGFGHLPPPPYVSGYYDACKEGPAFFETPIHAFCRRSCGIRAQGFGLSRDFQAVLLSGLLFSWREMHEAQVSNDAANVKVCGMFRLMSYFHPIYPVIVVSIFLSIIPI